MNEEQDWQDGELNAVINSEEQYSIWPTSRAVPPGWRTAGFSGKKEECLNFIRTVWTDMRPLSARQEFARLDAEVRSEPTPPPDVPQNDLVQVLSQGDHPVEVVLRPNQTVDALRASIERGFLLVRFLGTRGETELGVRLDRAASELHGEALTRGSGSIHLEGSLVLDDIAVRCVANIELPMLRGTGRLVVTRQ